MYKCIDILYMFVLSAFYLSNVLSFRHFRSEYALHEYTEIKTVSKTMLSVENELPSRNTIILVTD